LLWQFLPSVSLTVHGVCSGSLAVSVREGFSRQHLRSRGIARPRKKYAALRGCGKLGGALGGCGRLWEVVGSSGGGLWARNWRRPPNRGTFLCCFSIFFVVAGRVASEYQHFFGTALGGSGRLWEASGRPLGGLREASGKPLGGFWEASGRHLGGLWEASGKPKF